MIVLAAGEIVCEFSVDGRLHGAKVPHPRSLSKNGEGGLGDRSEDESEFLQYEGITNL